MKTRRKTPGNGRFFMHLMPALILGGLVACSSADPEIMQTDLRVIASLRPEDGSISRRLQVAVDVHDPDGSEDLDLLRVELLRYRLAWERPVDRLAQTTQAGQYWYTANDLDLPVDGPIGTVRLTVEDKSQRLAEREVVLPPSDDFARPELYPVVVSDPVDTAGDGGDPRIVVPVDTDTLYLMVLEADERFSDPIELDLRDVEPGTEVALPASVRERIEGRRFYLIVERSRSLWLETGPWLPIAPDE